MSIKEKTLGRIKQTVENFQIRENSIPILTHIIDNLANWAEKWCKPHLFQMHGLVELWQISPG